MLHYVGLILWKAIGCAGILLIYASLSYEDEEGRIQNLLEECWVKIDDLRQQAISRHVAFIKVLASIMTTLLDRLFGVRLLSFQSLGVSACYSMIWIGATMLLIHHQNPQPQSDQSHLVILLVFGLVYGSLPALENGRLERAGIPFVSLWFIGLLSVVTYYLRPFFFLVLFALATPGVRRGALLFVGVLLGLCFTLFLFTIFIGIMRLSLRAISRSKSPVKIVGLLLINLAPIVTFYGLIKVVEWWPTQSRFAQLSMFVLLALVICGILFNLIFVFSTALFILLAVTMLLHRLFWPAISRPLYKLQALGIAKRPLVFRVLGVILVGAGFGTVEWLSSLISKL